MREAIDILVNIGVPRGAVMSDRLTNSQIIVLRSLAKRYDTVVIDGPAVLAAADAALLAAAAEAAVLVVRGHRTERPVVRRALARLRAVHARVIGVVLNGVDPACGYYRSYAYPFAA